MGLKLEFGVWGLGLDVCVCVCVLCFVFCVLCFVFCVLCFVFCVLCFVFCVLCFVFCVLCFVFCVLCFVFYVLCSTSLMHLMNFCGWSSFLNCLTTVRIAFFVDFEKRVAEKIYILGVSIEMSSHKKIK